MNRLARLADEWAIQDTLAAIGGRPERRGPRSDTYHPGAYDDHGYFKGRSRASSRRWRRSLGLLREDA